MHKVIDGSGQLNLGLFDSRLLQQTSNLDGVISAAQRTQSSRLESTHFLMALTRIPIGLTQELFRSHNITLRDLDGGLAACVVAESDVPSPKTISESSLDASGRKLFATLNAYLETDKISEVDEGHLLLAILENLTPTVVDSLHAVQLRPSDLITTLENMICEYEPPVPMDGGLVHLEDFSSGGRHVLKLMQTESEALGYPQMDARHLLLALLEYEGGATRVALYQQDISPNQIQEKVMVNLRGRAPKTRTQLNLSREFMNPTIIHLLEQSAEEAITDRSPRIAEVHLFRAFLMSDTFALRQLTDAGLNLLAATEAVRRFRLEDEVAPAGSANMKSWKTIKADLQAALVGQEDAVEMCLPFVSRMHFGFRRPGKPAGVFLFCGPSGIGKTEMAKAIARAVFGGEENLLMLEMGQFQTKESMTIFVGAPPGYIGYGQGKLTNGLRDNPRSVVLFDEVEKAHPEVFDALLRFIDEGQIDDPAGPIRDGSECIIIMTSNVRTDGLEELARRGNHQKNKWNIRRQLREALLNYSTASSADASDRDQFQFRPEFLNRIDEIILFRKLDERDLTEIARNHLAEYLRRLRDEKHIELTFGPKGDPLTLREEAAAARLIGSFCNALDEGARSTLRVTQAAVLDPVIDFMYEQELSAPISLRIKLVPDPTTKEPRGIVSLPN